MRITMYVAQFPAMFCSDRGGGELWGECPLPIDRKSEMCTGSTTKVLGDQACPKVTDTSLSHQQCFEEG
eukprot:48587-Eustigmatos_ZCMA.PRE.1